MQATGKYSRRSLMRRIRRATGIPLPVAAYIAKRIKRGDDLHDVWMDDIHALSKIRAAAAERIEPGHVHLCPNETCHLSSEWEVTGPRGTWSPND